MTKFDLSVKLMRFIVSRVDAKRDKGAAIPDSVTYLHDITYGEGGTLDVCFPRSADGAIPTIVSIHGGGYVYGSAKLYSLYAADLARRGFAVVNFNYRLAPKSVFPAPVFDTDEVMLWIVENARHFHLDTENLFLLGDSAGAQLASQYAVILTNPDYAKVMEIDPAPVKLRAVALNCGLYDLSRAAVEKGITASYFTDDPAQFGRKLDVLSFINSDFPPTFIMSAGGDFLLGECEPMAAHLRSKGVDVDCKIYGDEKTGHVFHLDVRSPLAVEANDDEARFFMRHVR